LTGIGALAPVAAFTASPTNGITTLTVSFTDNSTGTITNRFWDFGDETSTNTTATTLTHTYTEAGAYTVGLTVGGPVGGSAITRTTAITVLDPPQLSLSPASLDFGAVVIGQTNTQSFQVVNTGGATLTGTVTASAPFAIQGSSPF